MDEIANLLSEKRLAKYKDISKENAVVCHLYNCELAESFYSSLSYFEIILRNKIDKVFSKQNILAKIGFLKVSILSAEIRII